MCDDPHWEKAGEIMQEVMNDFAFTKPVRVSLRDVQVRLRNHLREAAAAERASIVAWLRRSIATSEWNHADLIFTDIANMIERGYHAPPDPAER